MKNKNVSTYNEEHENRLVRRDLIQVIVLNLVLFGAMLALYFVNRASGSVDSFFSQFIKF